MSNEDCIDPKALIRLRELGEPKGAEFVRQMIGLFLEFAPKKLAEARAAELAGDLRGIQKAVHPLRSSSANVGARPMADLATRIEQLAGDGNALAIPPLLRELEASFPPIQARLEKERSALAP